LARTTRKGTVVHDLEYYPKSGTRVELGTYSTPDEAQDAAQGHHEKVGRPKIGKDGYIPKVLLGQQESVPSDWKTELSPNDSEPKTSILRMTTGHYLIHHKASDPVMGRIRHLVKFVPSELKFNPAVVGWFDDAASARAAADKHALQTYKVKTLEQQMEGMKNG
jgi:hypothetical protein